MRIKKHQMEELRKLYDITYEITHKKDEDSYALPIPVLIISLINENRTQVGFLPTTPIDNIYVEMLPESIPIFIEIINKLKVDLQKEQTTMIEKVKKENTRKIIINITLTEELISDQSCFANFEKELTELLNKYGFIGRIENFTTGQVFDFPPVKINKEYKI